MRRAGTVVVFCTAVLVSGPSLAGCGGDAPVVVPIGGSSASAGAGTVERPWGRVRTFPELEKAQIPTAADLRFAIEMVRHHEQALELSRHVLRHAEIDTRVAAAARFIAYDQGKEATTVRAWVDAWVASMPELARRGHGAHGRHEDGQLPGMVAPADVESVRRPPASDAQRLFLALMAEHHDGALAMAQDYLRDARNAFTRRVAQHVVREQTVELAYLRRLQAELAS